MGLFSNRPFCGALVATASTTFGIYGMIFLLPLVWQASGLLGPEADGLTLLPCALLFFLVSQRSGHLAQRVNVWRDQTEGDVLLREGARQDHRWRFHEYTYGTIAR